MVVFIIRIQMNRLSVRNMRNWGEVWLGLQLWDMLYLTSFMAFCLLTTLRAMAREHAPGLTPRQIIANLKTIKMVDVVMPTTDGRVVTLPRYIEPKDDVSLLLNRLGLTLPDQPPPKISENPSST